MQGNGPRRRGSRLSVLSAKPSGAPIDPRHPEISGGLRRLHRRVHHRHLGAFGAILDFSSDLIGIVLPMRSEENKMTAKSAELESQSTNQTSQLFHQTPYVKNFAIVRSVEEATQLA